MSLNLTLGTATVAANATYSSMIGLLLSIATIIATVMLFRKAGKEGWEALIPFYNRYVEYKLFWATKMFWVSFALHTFTILFLLTIFLIEIPVFIITAFLGFVGLIACFVLDIKKTQKMAHAFGRYGMFTVGLFFFTAIFKMIMAFSDDEYVGANL